MRVEHAALGLLAVLLFAPRTQAQDAGVAAAPPDLEFLEYIGSLVREGDGWVDPTDLRGPAEEARDRAVDEAPSASAPAASGAKEE
jgi:hypothetical protein